MFPSLDTNGYDLFDSLNPSQTSMLPSFTTHHIQNPNSHHSFPFSEDFLSNCGGEPSLETQLLLQSKDVFGSCDGKNLDVSPRKVIKKREQRKKNEKCVNGCSKGKQIVPRRRTGKKDRHSKIFTAQGPRDRRMRLSLQIARKFFDLQDMLGFDKASKTIEWLFSKSKSSIKQLKESVASANGDGGREREEEDFEHIQADEKENDETLEVIVSKRRTKTIESSCKMKESREKARKRARERTITKMKMRSSLEHNQETKRIKITNDSNDAKVEVEVENQEQEWSKVNMEENQIDSVSIIEKFLGLNTNSSSSSIFGDSEESYTSLITSTRDAISTAVLREGNITSKASTDEERNPTTFSVYDYLCY